MGRNKLEVGVMERLMICGQNIAGLCKLKLIGILSYKGELTYTIHEVWWDGEGNRGLRESNCPLPKDGIFLTGIVNTTKVSKSTVP